MLGGEERLLRIQTEKDASTRYPIAMARMRGLLERCSQGTLPEQIGAFLEKASLSSRPTETLERRRVAMVIVLKMIGSYRR